MALLFALVSKKFGHSVIIIQKRTAELSQSGLERFVSRAKRAAGLAGELNVKITSSRELRRLNQRFRGNNAPTDVLSFPAIHGRSNGFAGDVAISADIAAANARRLGHSTAQELKILALHGILHLAGYDHERDNGRMAAKEARLRKQLALPVGLIERNGHHGKQLLTAKNANRARGSRSKGSRRGAPRISR